MLAQQNDPAIRLGQKVVQGRTMRPEKSKIPKPWIFVTIGAY